MQAVYTIGHTSTLVVLIVHLIIRESVGHTYFVDIQKLYVSTISYYDTQIFAQQAYLIHEYTLSK